VNVISKSVQRSYKIRPTARTGQAGLKTAAFNSLINKPKFLITRDVVLIACDIHKNP